MQASVLLQLALAALPVVTVAVGQFIAWINALRTAMQQSDEWTPELEAQYRAALLAKTNDPAYQPDAE